MSNLPPPTGMIRSPDGTQWWDGTTWQPIVSEAPPDAVISPDGQSWWDGMQWVAFSSASRIPASPQSAVAPPAPAGPTYAPVAAVSQSTVVEWSGGRLHADVSRIVAMTSGGAVIATFEYATIQRAYIDGKSNGDTVAIQRANEVRSFDGCVPRETVSQLVALLRSQGVSVEQRNWAGASVNAVQSSYAPGSATSSQMRDAGPLSAEKVGIVGALLVAATLIIVSAFLTWYTFETQGGFPVQGASGITNGYGIAALIFGAFTVLNGIILAVATSVRSTKVAIRALWTDVVLIAITLVLGIVDVSSGGWVVVGTSIPLVASPGPGLYLLGAGELALLIAAIRATIFLRRNAWSWSSRAS
jgi:hypothetical protein